LIDPTPPTERSFALRARAVVAACGIAACGLVALANGCMVTQDLGAEDAGIVRPDTKGVDVGGTGSSPDAGFDPQLPTADLDTKKCPAVSPVDGFSCPTNFRVDGMSPVQCSYALSFTRVDINGVGHRICARTCVCGFGGSWSCIESLCATPKRKTCAEGMPCLAGAECSFGCDTGDDSTCRRCTCDGDQRLVCGKVPTK